MALTIQQNYNAFIHENKGLPVRLADCEKHLADCKKEVTPVRTGFEQLCLSHLPQLGLKLAKKGQEEKNGVGFTFVPEPEVGEGYLWTYPINAVCSLTIYDVVFHQDMSFRYHHPAALTVAVSSPGSAEPALTKPCTNPENLVGYFLEEGTFGHTIPKNTPVRSIGIGLMPEFYEQQLPALMGQDATQVRKAACALDGTVSLPEVEGLLHQMAAYLPQAGTAGLRYEAKVFDLLAALLEWNDLTLSTPAAACISAKDQEALQASSISCFRITPPKWISSVWPRCAI